MKVAAVLSLCLFLLISCSNKNRVPGDVLKPPKMQDVMWDMFQAQAWAQQSAAKDSTTTVAIETKKLSEKVFKIHGISSEEFTDSYQWYLRHPTLLNKILDSISSQSLDANPLLPDRPHLPESERIKPGLTKPKLIE